MGFGDYVIVEATGEEAEFTPGTRFYTKNLCQTGSEFTVTATGELIQQLYRYEDHLDPAHVPRPQRIATGQRRIDYHGDLFLWGDPRNFVVRFTHGQFEWIRPAEDYTEQIRQLLMEQGAR
jgi:hypothetical protein